MLYPHAQIEWNHWRAESIRPDTIIRVTPEPDQPRGRKGVLMAEYWQVARAQGAAGVIWQDPDIVIDPGDRQAMLAAIGMRPADVHCSTHKLWPASTMRDDWVWGHGITDGIYHQLGQTWHARPDWWALGYTYTPGRLLDLAAPHMPAWVFGQVDSGLSAVAVQHGIPAWAIRQCQPKHLHFYPREDDASWRPGMIKAQ